MSATQNTIHILGAGSIGLLWACRLVELGVTPTLITRQPASNLHIHRTENNKTENFQLDAVSTSDIFSINFLLITTKAHQTQSAVLSIKQQIRPDAIIVLLQNGMGNGEWLVEQFPTAKIYLGTTTDGVFRTEKTAFTLAGVGETYFGPFTANANKEGIELLLTADKNTFWDNNINAKLWQKLAVNCVINPLAALYECKNGELITHPDYFSHFKIIAAETQTAFQSLHIPTPQPSLLEFAKRIAEKTAANINSMLADKHAGSGTEIDFILGYLLSKLDATQFPHLQTLYQVNKTF